MDLLELILSSLLRKQWVFQSIKSDDYSLLRFQSPGICPWGYLFNNWRRFCPEDNGLVICCCFCHYLPSFLSFRQNFPPIFCKTNNVKVWSDLQPQSSNLSRRSRRNLTFEIQVSRCGRRTLWDIFHLLHGCYFHQCHAMGGMHPSDATNV